MKFIISTFVLATDALRILGQGGILREDGRCPRIHLRGMPLPVPVRRRAIRALQSFLMPSGTGLVLNTNGVLLWAACELYWDCVWANGFNDITDPEIETGRELGLMDYFQHYNERVIHKAGQDFLNACGFLSGVLSLQRILQVAQDSGFLPQHLDNPKLPCDLSEIVRYHRVRQQIQHHQERQQLRGVVS